MQTRARRDPFVAFSGTARRLRNELEEPFDGFHTTSAPSTTQYLSSDDEMVVDVIVPPITMEEHEFETTLHGIMTRGDAIHSVVAVWIHAFPDDDIVMPCKEAVGTFMTEIVMAMSGWEWYAGNVENCRSNRMHIATEAEITMWRLEAVYAELRPIVIALIGDVTAPKRRRILSKRACPAFSAVNETENEGKVEREAEAETEIEGKTEREAEAETEIEGKVGIYGNIDGENVD